MTRPSRFVVCSIGVLASLPALAGQATHASQRDGTPAWRRHHETIYLSWLRLKDPGRRTGRSDIDALSMPALRERLQPIVLDLTADLEDPALNDHEKQSTLAELTMLGEVASKASPAIVGMLHDYDRDEAFKVSRFCVVTKALGAIDPRSPQVVDALAKALDADLRSGSGICHRCGCVLDALQQAGPAARSIAGPVLERAAARGTLLTTYPNQLGRALEAVGTGRAARPLLVRVESHDVLPDDRAASLRALASSFPDLAADERARLQQSATWLLTHRSVSLRIAAAEALGSVGAPAVDSLTRALGDAHYQVRIAAAGSLARLGRAALSARGALLDALDPFLGTAAAAGRALVAIGPDTLPDLRARAARAAPPLRPVVAATEDAIRTGRPALVDEAVRRHFTAGPGGRGFVRIDTLSAGAGVAFDPARHRIRFRFRSLGYGAARNPPATAEGRITADGAPNTVFAALKGRNEGARLRVLLSPEVAESPYSGTSRHNDSWRVAEAGASIHLDVSIEEICQPVVWTIFRGSGIIGEMKVELYCRG